MSELVVEVSVDARWVPLSLTGDVDAESAETASDVLRARGDEQPDAERLEGVTAMVAGLARHARATDDEEARLVAAFALMPDEQPYPLTTAALRVSEGAWSVDETIAELVAPEEERYEDPVVDVVDTPLGQAGRVTQRLVRPDATVTEWLAYAWPLPDAERTLVLSATFLDLVEAARWADAFDDLATGVAAWVEE